MFRFAQHDRGDFYGGLQPPLLFLNYAVLPPRLSEETRVRIELRERLKADVVCDFADAEIWV